VWKREGSGSEINNFGSGSLRPNNFGSGQIRNTALNSKKLIKASKAQKQATSFLLQHLGEAACVACYSLRYTWKPRHCVLVQKCTDTPLLGTLFIKKENKTDFVCESVPRSGVLLHLCTEMQLLGSQSVPRRRVLGPNRKQLLFLMPRLSLLCILQRQIRSTKWRGFALQIWSKTSTLP